jgi:hypothetical protein
MGEMRIEQAFTREEDLLAQDPRQFVIVVELPMSIPMSRRNISVRFSGDLDFEQHQKRDNLSETYMT